MSRHLSLKSLVAGLAVALPLALGPTGGAWTQQAWAQQAWAQEGSVPSEPPNLGQMRAALTDWVSGGSYDRALSAAARQGLEIVQAAAAARKPGDLRLAVVFDIDETALSNLVTVPDKGPSLPSGPCTWPVAQNNPCGWRDWQRTANDRPIVPVRQIADFARANDIAVFFVSGRPESMRDKTEANLKAAGYTDYQGLTLVPDDKTFASAVEYKAPARAAIEAQGYVVVLSLGDQYSDLLGGHAANTVKLPNPFYFIP